MNLIVLTSSRADFGIYLPLLNKIKKDSFFQLKIVAFGTHLSNFHGFTINDIIANGFKVTHRIENILASDSQSSIATSMALTSLKLTSIWEEEKDWTDLIICLGDRYEMFAAVASSIPFNIPIAHLHGGEITLGAIDNTFRNCLTMMSNLHFVSTPEYEENIKLMTRNEASTFYVGALSLDNIESLKLLNIEEFKVKYGIDLSFPSVLITFHPETLKPEKNTYFVEELIRALATIEYQLIITMPNADTQGHILREKLQSFVTGNPKAHAIENFGTIGYFSCMRHCSYMLGNTSSGIIEGASFNKYVINLGDRQSGRAKGENILDCTIDKQSILNTISIVKEKGQYNGKNIYFNGGASEKIIEVLKNHKHDF